MTSDLHMHPLGHKYYDMLEGFSKIVLDDEDKADIRAVVDWCCHERKLNAIALTDHDMIQTGLYAREYAEQAGLPIELITGAECTVQDPNEEKGDGEVHLLCLSLEKLPKYDFQTHVDEMIKTVRDMGGYVIMSHPGKYPKSFYRYAHLLDGYEYLNSNLPPFDEGKKHVELNGLQIRAFNNSDFHYDGFKLIDAGSELLHNTYYDKIILTK